MRKLLIILFLGVSALNSTAQKQAVLDLFKKHYVDAGILEEQSKEPLDDHSYDLKYTMVSDDKASVTLAKYDPSKPESGRWTVISVNGKAPGNSDIKKFVKSHSKHPVSAKIDEATFLVEKETPEYIVISYKQNAAFLPAEAQFMKDCRIHMTINLKTKRMEKLQSLNEKPLKIKIFNAEKLDAVVKVIWKAEEQRYFTVSEDMSLIVKFLAQFVTMETISEYSNYKKVI